jgi:hypothetical protein
VDHAIDKVAVGDGLGGARDELDALVVKFAPGQVVGLVSLLERIVLLRAPARTCENLCLR